MQTLQDHALFPFPPQPRRMKPDAYIRIGSPFREPIEEPPPMASIQARLSNLFLMVYCHSNTKENHPKRKIGGQVFAPAAVAVNHAEEIGKLGPNSSPSFAAILQLALQREYQDSAEKIPSEAIPVNVGLLTCPCRIHNNSCPAPLVLVYP